MVALVLIAYAIGLVFGESLRSHSFPETHRKWKIYSGLFVLLKFNLILQPQKYKVGSPSSLVHLRFYCYSCANFGMINC